MTAIGWRDDMENAPRDGTPVLVFTESGLVANAYYNRGWIPIFSGKVLYRDPTHWMPLPPPPEDKPDG